MTERIVQEVDATEDPSLVLTFSGEGGSEVTMKVTVGVEGDLRTVWPDLEGLDEREALHAVANDLFMYLTREA